MQCQTYVILQNTSSCKLKKNQKLNWLGKPGFKKPVAFDMVLKCCIINTFKLGRVVGCMIE